MRIGVVTFVGNGNYGSELQAIAMDGFCKKLGHDIEFCKVRKKTVVGKAIDVLANRFTKKAYCIINKEYKVLYTGMMKTAAGQAQISAELREKIAKFVQGRLRIQCMPYPTFRKSYDCYICGSDQIWSPLKLTSEKQNYLAGISKAKKIAYAPSIGINTVPAYYKKITDQYIADFQYLSVRETSGAEYLKNNGCGHVQKVLDPTVMINPDFWHDFCSSVDVRTIVDEPYCLCYFLGRISDEQKRFIAQQADGRRIVVLPYESAAGEIENGLYYPADPAEFVALIRNADFVFTDSFHGTVFSCILHRPFIVFERSHLLSTKQTSRIESFLGETGLDACLCVDVHGFAFCEPQYEQVEEKLNVLREKSQRFLCEALQAVATREKK